MTIVINAIEINKAKILNLLSKGKKLQAIKTVREQLDVGLYESKIIVENLEQNPNFYDGRPHTITTDFPDMETIETQSTRSKSGHIISNTSSKFKDTVIIFIIIAIVVLLLIQFSK
ncbi:hypothetical protein [Olleya marilimosa]|uniref:hypothetical protein n=1 Tax=Olleya marilimosa TaxID=272164 RepID=UPI00168CF6EE|nr:hypothetical protein [Olleya marilimosa]MBD3891246.1 hypothetical protein [Olleya marilimosa]